MNSLNFSWTLPSPGTMNAPSTISVFDHLSRRTSSTSNGLDGRMIGHHFFHWPIGSGLTETHILSTWMGGYGGRDLPKTSCEDIVLEFQKVITEWWIHTYLSLLVEQDIDPKHTISLGVWSFWGLRDTSLSSPEGSWLYIITCNL